jgi:hypothetical protein
LRSDQGRCASKLLSAYSEGDIEEIKRLAQSSAVSNLDHVVRISIPLYLVICSTLPDPFYNNTMLSGIHLKAQRRNSSTNKVYKRNT